MRKWRESKKKRKTKDLYFLNETKIELKFLGGAQTILPYIQVLQRVSRIGIYVHLKNERNRRGGLFVKKKKNQENCLKHLKFRRNTWSRVLITLLF